MKVAKYDTPIMFADSEWVKSEYAKHNEFADKVNSTEDSYPNFCDNCLCDSWFEPQNHTCLFCGLN